MQTGSFITLQMFPCARTAILTLILKQALDVTLRISKGPKGSALVSCVLCGLQYWRLAAPMSVFGGALWFSGADVAHRRSWRWNS